MKITGIHIFAFGRHEEVQLTFGDHLNIIYGENEAGKTTIQQFILHVLFGFPPRNSILLRYEPLHANKYGGQVHLKDEQYGNVIVERVGGKSSGHVTLYFEDGTKGNEDQLQKILRQYDRTAFEAIFSFSLLQLQGFEKMDEETLSRTLFASGTTGIDDLLKIEAKMEKELSEQYKRYGKKPIINEQIQKIQQLEKERLAEREKFSRYEEATNRKVEIERQLADMMIEQGQIKEQFKHARLQQQLAPLNQERQVLEKRLELLQGEHFPVDGKTRYEALKYQLQETEATEKAIQQQIEEIDKRAKEGPNEELISQFEHFLQQEAEWHRIRSSLEQYRITFQQLQTEKSQLLTRLGIQSDIEVTQLRSANASLQQEEEMYTLLAQMEACEQELNDVEQAVAKQQQEIEKLQERQQILQGPDEETLEQVREWPMNQQRLADAKAFIHLQGGQAKQLQSMKTIIFIILGLLFIIGIASQQWLITISSIFLFVATMLYMRKQQGIQQDEEAEQTISKLEPIAKNIDQMMAVVQTFEQDKSQIQEQLADRAEELEQLTEQGHALRQEQQYTKQQLSSFLQQYGIDTLPSTKLVPELFRLIRDAQEAMRKMNEVEQQGQMVKQQLNEWLAAAKDQLKIEANEQILYEQIRQTYQSHIRMQEQQLSLAERRAHYVQQLTEVQIVHETLTTQLTQLFTEAEVSSEKAYYAMYEEARERAKLTEQLNTVQSQLDVYEDQLFDWTFTQYMIDEIVTQKSEQLTQLEEKRQQLVEENMQLTHESQNLLSDETYRALVQQVEIEKANLAEMAKEWAMKKAISTAIINMMDSLKEERFPAVLEQAVMYFRHLTGGRYTSLVINEESLFEAETKDGKRFPIMSLSQATKEQAYISLRFALAHTIQRMAPFPIIMDDPFVHFDEQRLQYMVQLLQQLTSTQFLYFTCHAQMKERIEGATTMTISNTEQKEGAK